MGGVSDYVKIAFVISYLADRYGGPVTVVKNLGPTLTQKGHSISYWTTIDGDEDGELPLLDAIHAYDVRWPRGWRRSPGLAKDLASAVSSVDVMQISELWLYSTYAASKIARLRGLPYILRPAGCLEPWRLQRGRLRRFKKATYLYLIGNKAIGAAACLQAVSKQEAEHFDQLGHGIPITIIPNAIDVTTLDGGDSAEAEIHWPDLKNRPVVVFMSRLSAEKGLDLLIPVWAQLVSCATYGDAMLVVAGPDYRGYQKVVEQLIERHGVRQNVLMLGMVQGRKKASLLRRADIFVLPSYSENFGIVVAEALACGTPVITTTGTPWERLQQIDAGRWIPPVKSELLEVLREMLSMSAARRREMGRRGMSFVRSEYTWEKAACKFLHVCNCILRGNAIPLHPDSEP